LNTGKFDLHKLLDKVTNTANALIRLRNIDVKFILEKELVLDTVTIEGDQFRIEQIINNLISNAIKFTSKGYIKLSYRFLKANILEIKVEDTG
ncbi:sensor histidine kinase, partial [Klebsiella pneumoniae]|uniref:sensor histidine kinase n=1 Tax=Klebsiella pneumoniae TaxID=573 RepID=UPI0021B0F2D8